MKKNLPDSVRVTQPCGESWDEMIGSDTVRFCTHCAKDVNNLSEMTERDALRLVRKSGGQLCVRYRINPRTGGPMFSTRLASFARHGIAAGVVGASLLGGGSAYAQGGGELVQIERLDKTGAASAKISGYVIDPNGAAISYALVTLTNMATLQSHVQNATGEGFYEFKELDAGQYRLRFEAGGFAAREFTDMFLSESGEIRRDGHLAIANIGEAVEVLPTLDVKHDVLVGVIDISSEFVNFNPLVTAVLDDDLENVKARMMMGARVNSRDKAREGMSALHAAVETGNLEIAEYLLQHGAKVNIRDYDKQTPLMVIDGESEQAMFELLVRYGAKLTLRDKEKNGVLHHFAEAGVADEILRSAITFGADLNGVNKAGKTPLMLAVSEGNSSAAKILIEAGAIVDQETAASMARIMNTAATQ